MPAIPLVVIAIDYAATVAATDLVATIGAASIFADAAGTLTLVGDIAAGALGGLVGGIAGGALEGGNILTSGLEGLAGGALSGGISGLAGGASFTGGDLPTSAAATDVGAGTLSGGNFLSGITNTIASSTGIPTDAVKTVLGAITKAGTSAASAAATGQNIGEAALGGAISGGVGTGLGAGVGENISLQNIATDTGLPLNVVQGIVQGLGQAATGSIASAAAGGDPGLGAAQGFVSGTLPTAIKYAEAAAASVYNSVVSFAQDAISSITDEAQTMLTSIQQQLDAQKGPLEAQVQQASDAYNAALNKVNQNTTAVKIANGQQTQAEGRPGTLQYLQYQKAQVLVQQFSQAQQNLESANTNVQQQWEQIQSAADQQAQQVIDNANGQITNYQGQIDNAQDTASQYFTQALPVASQGISQGQDANTIINGILQTINPISSAEASQGAVSPDQYIGPYQGATVTYDLGDGSGEHTGVIASGGEKGVGITLTDGSKIGLGLISSITAPSGPPVAPGDFSNLDFTPPVLSPPTKPDTQPDTAISPPTKPDTQSAGGSGTGDQSGNVAPQSGSGGPGGGTSGLGSGSGTGNGVAGGGSPQDASIMELAGITPPPSATEGQGQPSQSILQGGGAPLNFTTGFNTGVSRQSTPNLTGNPGEPGSAALAQALSLPGLGGLGAGPGADIFGTKGRRTPVWNKSSLRSDDTSGV